jgi:hypothetical protein
VTAITTEAQRDAARRSKDEAVFYELRRMARQLYLLTDAAFQVANDPEEMDDRLWDLKEFVERAAATLEAQHDGTPHDAEDLQSVLYLTLPAIAGAAKAVHPDCCDVMTPETSWNAARWLDSARTVAQLAAAVFAPRTIEEADAIAGALIWHPGTVREEIPEPTPDRGRSAHPAGEEQRRGHPAPIEPRRVKLDPAGIHAELRRALRPLPLYVDVARTEFYDGKKHGDDDDGPDTVITAIGDILEHGQDVAARVLEISEGMGPNDAEELVYFASRIVHAVLGAAESAERSPAGSAEREAFLDSADFFATLGASTFAPEDWKEAHGRERAIFDVFAAGES